MISERVSNALTRETPEGIVEKLVRRISEGNFIETNEGIYKSLSREMAENNFKDICLSVTVDEITKLA